VPEVVNWQATTSARRFRSQLGILKKQKKEDDMDNLWLSLFWTGPIGIGIFLMGLGVLFWGIAKVMKSRKE